MNKNASARIIFLDEAYEMAYRVSKQITDSSDSFDIILGISRGGLPPARMISDFLNIETLTSLQISHYARGGVEKEKVHVTDPLNIDIEGKKVLIVDDVNDSGETLKAAYEHAGSLNPADVKTAVLHEKESTSFHAHYTGSDLSEWKWLIYQWAVTEDILEFLNKDGMLNAEEKTAINHLSEKYGLKIEIDLFRKIVSMKDSYFQRS